MLTEKFQKVVAAVPSAMGQEESAVMTRKALLSYANNDMKGTVAALRQAYYKDPRNEKLLSLLNKIEADAAMEKTEPPKGPELFSPIDQKVFEQIAEIMGVPVGTIKSRMHYAVAHLRRVLEEEELVVEGQAGRGVGILGDYEVSG